MARGPRRVRNLNLDAAVLMQGNNACNEHVNEDNLQGPPAVDNALPGLPKQPAWPIKMICKFDIFCCTQLSFLDV